MLFRSALNKFMITSIKRLFLTGVAVFSLLISSCNRRSNTSYADAADCSTTVDSLNTYTNSVKPIFDTHCAGSGCHNLASHKSSLIFSDYSNTMEAFNRKHVLCAIHHDRNCKPMPFKQPKLEDSLIQKIDCWVKGGMKE